MSAVLVLGFLTFKLPSRLLAGLFVLGVAGCNNSGSTANNPAHGCAANSTNSCKATSGCRGVQHCQSDGTWSLCDCTDDPNAPLLGSTCSDDSTCPTGAFCLLPSGTAWLGGGPPEGLCVADCSTNIDRCLEFSGAACVSSLRSKTETPKRALCMPTCNLTIGTKEAFACNSVPSSACEALDNAVGASGYCRPFCQFDSDCPGAHCDGQWGVCVAAALPTTLGGFGAGCTATSECAGTCLHLGAEGAGVCTNRCTYGFADQYGADIQECGIEGAPKFAGVCLFATSAAVPGNLGFCTPLCDCNDHCLAAGFVCKAFSTDQDAGTSTVLGHRGMCVPAYDTNGYADPGVACGG